MVCRKFRLFVVGVALVAVFSVVGFAEEETRGPAVEESKQQETVAEGTSALNGEGKETNKFMTEEQVKIKLLENELGNHREAVTSLKWGIGGIIGMIGIIAAVFALVVYKQSRDYKEAVAEAKAEAGGAVTICKEAVREIKVEVKDAIKEMKTESKEAVAEVKDIRKEADEIKKEARSACDNAQEWEGKAQEKVEKIDKEVKEKLKEIDKEGKEKLKEIDKEGKEKLKEIDKRADKKFKEVDDKIKKVRKASVQQVSDEGKKQREISRMSDEALKAYHEKEYEKACELWKQLTGKDEKNWSAFNNWGLALSGWARQPGVEGAEDKFGQACGKYEKAVRIKPDCHQAFNNWGAALAGWAKLPGVEGAEDKFGLACEKYAEAVKIKPDYHQAFNNWGAALDDWAKLPGVEGAEDKFRLAFEKYAEAVKIKPDYHRAYKNWGNAISFLAMKKEGKEREGLLDEAIEKCMAAEGIKKGGGAYNLGCAYALKGDKEKCREWLEVCGAAGELPTREHAMKDADLASVRGEDWFEGLGWK